MPAIKPPLPITTVTQVCRLPLAVEERNRSSEGPEFVDLQPCYTGNEYLYLVHAAAGEMNTVVKRPKVSLRIDDSGTVCDLRLIRSSGNASLDDRALHVILGSKHNKNYCQRCSIATTVNVEWDGPVWFR